MLHSLKAAAVRQVVIAPSGFDYQQDRPFHLATLPNCALCATERERQPGQGVQHEQEGPQLQTSSACISSDVMQNCETECMRQQSACHMLGGHPCC